MATYTFAQLEGLWINAGGSATLAPVMAAIAMAESGGRSDAVGHNSNGSSDTGLWQINSVHDVSGMTDPVANAKEAVAIYKSQGLSAWTTYTSGAYKKFLQSGVAADTGISGNGATGSTSTADQASAVGDIGSEIGKGFAEGLSDLFQPLISVIVWGVETLLGGALMALGAYLMVSQTQGFKKAVSTVSKDAMSAAEPELAPEVEGM